MSGHIIRLHGDHDEVQALMPWYVTGTLDGEDQAKVEAHLGVCPECQAELRFERRLDAEVAGLPFDVEQSWTALQRRLDLTPAKRASGGAVRAWLDSASRRARRTWRSSPPWLGWALAAQFVLLLIGGLALAPSGPVARYHALGAAPAVAAGNVVVIFRPDTRESTLRETLRASHARLVDGPTAADAYLLQVPAAQRSAVLTRLRGQTDIVLAEPVDSGGPP